MQILTKGRKRKIERRRHRKHWNIRFAWRQVVVHIRKDGSRLWAWFKKVERRGKHVRYEWRSIGGADHWAVIWEWKYRLPPTDQNIEGKL